MSSMLIIMFVLAPIIIRCRKIYTYYIAPILSMALTAVIFKKCNTFNVFILKGNLVWLANARALAEISFGIIIYEVTEKGLFDKFNRKLLLFAEFVCYLITFTYAFKELDRTLEPSVLLVLILGVTLTFNKKTSLNFLNNKFVYFLGKLSLAVYLCHSVARYCIAEKDSLFGGYYSHLGAFLALSFIFALVCLFTVKLMRNCCGG